MTALCSGSRSSRTADGRRLELTALTPEGLDVLGRAGWEALRTRLELPEAWFVAEARFHDEPRLSELEPFLVAEAAAATSRCLTFYVHPDLRWFSGHFPGRPILPGVVQIDWAARHGTRLGFDERRFAGLSGIKFAAPVAPGAVVALTLAAGRAGSLSFVLESCLGVHSRGMLHYRD